jgi:hypothetical protein
MKEKATTRIFKSNLVIAKRLWPGQLSRVQLESLKTLCCDYNFSVASGDLLLLDGRWYVTHSGLIRLSRRSNCSGIHVQPVLKFCDVPSGRWVFRATVHKGVAKRGFVGYGDANPSNVSPLVHGAEMRVAETRAVNRALRKAYGIGLCSVEELGYLSSPREPAARNEIASRHPNGNGFGNGQPRLRDRLCLLIRQHQLDPALVKRYAADFCGTQELREASRGLVESFITHLAEWAARDRAGLLCKLNSFAPSQEVHS